MPQRTGFMIRIMMVFGMMRVQNKANYKPKWDILKTVRYSKFFNNYYEVDRKKEN